MASYVTPKKNTALKFYIALVDQTNTKLTKANPTIASGDFKVSTDGGAFANLATLPSANPASGRAVMIDLSSGEMNGDNVVVQCVDAAGAEWCDLVVNIQTTARQIDDLAFPATTGRSVVVDANGLIDANMVKAGPTGSGTAQAAGDIYSRLGAPAGASVSADIAAAKVDTAAIKVQSDKLTFTVPNQLDVNVLDWKSATAPAMTGDAFARLGAPAGASTAADIAAVKVDTAAVKVQTDKLAFTVANQVDCNVLTFSTAFRAGIRKNTALATFEILMTDSTNHNPATGLTVTITRSIDGGAFAAGTLGAVTELSNGIYKFDFAAGDLNGTIVTLRATAVGADDLFLTIHTDP